MSDDVSIPNGAPGVPAPQYLVGILYYGAVDREHDRCVQRLKGHPLVADVLELTGCPYIDMGRSIIATAILDKPELGGVLFIDHDMVFAPEEAIRCIESAERTQSTVGGAYSMRKPGQIIGGIDGGKLVPGQKVVFFEGGEILPANYLGMGMTAIPRSVLERLVAASHARHDRQQENLKTLRSLLTGALGGSDASDLALQALEDLVPELREEDLQRLTTGLSTAPCVPFFSHLRERGFYYGEDVSFCVRSHQANVPVSLDTRVRVYHKGAYCYGLEDVGMEVPFCERLEVVDVAQPKAAAALFSQNETVRDALATAYAESLAAIPLERASRTVSEAVP